MRPRSSWAWRRPTLVAADPAAGARRPRPRRVPGSSAACGRRSACSCCSTRPRSCCSELPTGYHACSRLRGHRSARLPARASSQGSPSSPGWSPSRLCFTTVDSVRTKDYPLADKSGKHPQLFALLDRARQRPVRRRRRTWCSSCSPTAIGSIRTARLAGQEMREARLTVGKVPAEDENGVPSSDDRFQVKLGRRR